MMNKDLMQARIDSLATDYHGYYQPIKFMDGVMTHSKKWPDSIFHSMETHGLRKWNQFIRPVLPFKLDGKTMIDIGCNAGLFLIQTIKEGAEKCYGIESKWEFFRQCELTLRLFSEIDGMNYHEKIEIFNARVQHWPYREHMKRRADLMLALNILYWLDLDENGMIAFLEKASNMADYIVICCDQEVQAYRQKNDMKDICTGIETTLPFLEEDYDILSVSEVGHKYRTIVARIKPDEAVMVDVGRLIDACKLINQSVGKGLVPDFFGPFMGFCEYILHGKGSASEYKDYIAQKVNLQGGYGGIKNPTAKDIGDKMARDADLVRHIAKNKTCDPIRIEKGEGGFHCDGFHRLAICKVLGIEEIQAFVRPKYVGRVDELIGDNGDV